jgi:glycosyltransferase involved in cell wall biosynthesis
LIDRLDVGGTETQLLALIGNLDRKRVEPYLCVLDGAEATSRVMAPTDCPVLRLGIRSLRSVVALSQAARFVRFLRRERIDILQVYFHDSALFGALLGRLAGVRHILRVRNNLGYWMTRGYRRRFRVVNCFVTKFLTNSDAGRDALIEQEGVDPASVVVVNNGIDLDRFTDSGPAAAGPRTGPRRVGVVANLRPVKGLDVFLRAAALVAGKRPDVVFAIAGEGPERPNLELLASQLGLAGRFRLLGRVDDIPRILAQLDVVVQSSHSEGLSNALLEAMAAGKPTIATAVGANPIVIRDGIDGLLVPHGNPERLAAAIDHLLNRPKEASMMGRSAQQAVRERFSWPVVAGVYERFYLGLAGISEHDV